MSAPIYRPDYAKFVMDLPRGLFDQYYRRLNAESHKAKFYGDWLKSHHVQALPSQHADMERTVLEIWGEWTGLVRRLPFVEWSRFLKRFDVRAIIWDADDRAVRAVGVALGDGQSHYNVETFKSQPASKRKGRDRGGVGFRLGSRKSDVCSVIYKRAQEPVAHEIRLQGQVLRNCLDFSGRASSLPEVVVDAWQQLIDRTVIHGMGRLQKALEASGIGTYWPATDPHEPPTLPPLQASFAAHIEPTQQDLDEYNAWADAVSRVDEG